MKKRTTCLILILLLSLVITSCSIHKRQYRSGYHVEFNKHVQSSNKYTQAEDSSSYSIANTQFGKNEKFCPRIDPPACLEKEDMEHIITNNPPLEYLLNTDVKASSEISRVLPMDVIKKSRPYEAQPKDDSGNKLLRIIGWTLIVLGGIVLWFVSIIVGIVLMLAGLVFVLVGRKKSVPGLSGNDSNAVVDVVYLKNGSIIRGTIIEQVPGVSLKIETSDGSVFFYKMEEIEKITKEKVSE
jgi:hypothetical protein